MEIRQPEHYPLYKSNIINPATTVASFRFSVISLSHGKEVILSKAKRPKQGIGFRNPQTMF